MIIVSARQSENDKDVFCLGLLELTSVQTMHINKEFEANVELKDDLTEDSSWKISQSLSNTQSHRNLGTPIRNSISFLIWIRLVLLKWSSLIPPTYGTLLGVVEQPRSAGTDEAEPKASPQERAQVQTASECSVLVTRREPAQTPSKHRQLDDWILAPDISVSRLTPVMSLHWLM